MSQKNWITFLREIAAAWKNWAKFLFHWTTFLGAISAAVYILFFMNGDHNWEERGALAAAALAGIFTALSRLRPIVDKQIDGLPELPSREPEGGFGRLIGITITMVITFVFMALSFTYPPQARADEATAVAPPVAALPAPQTVSEEAKGNLKFTLTIGAVASMLDLKTGALIVGAPLGTCLGATYLPLNSGLAGCFHFQLATKDAPNKYVGSIQGNYKGLIGLGIGLMKAQGVDGTPVVLYFSGSVPLLGGS